MHTAILSARTQIARNLLVKTIGFPATMIHGDTLMLDRWLWLKRRLPVVAPGSKRLLDVGCGSGAFTIGAARRGYSSLGLSWDERNQRVAGERAQICNVSELASFEVLDVRNLDRRTDLRSSFDIVICLENIEHILDDRKLMTDMSNCLSSGGTLLLTTPNLHFKPMRGDNAPLSQVEDGGHVRRGYTPDDLKALCSAAGLTVCEIGYCSGFLSQTTTSLIRTISKISHPLVSWLMFLPLRPFLPVFDQLVSKLLNWPGYSITLVARKA